MPVIGDTSIELKTTYNKDILAGDLAIALKYNFIFGSFNKNILQNYVSFRSIVPQATYKMKDLVVDNTKISFTILALDAIDNVTVKNKEFKINIVDLLYKIDSINHPFVSENIAGDGQLLAEQILIEISPGIIINPHDEENYNLWTKLVDAHQYPPNTNFTILEMSEVDRHIYNNFSIKFSASSYYQNNLTINNVQERTIDINNLKFSPISIKLKETLPTNVNAKNFFSYIEYNSTNGAFNATKLQELVILNGFDLRTLGGFN